MPRRDWVQAPDFADLNAARDWAAWITESVIAMKARAPSLPAPERVTSAAISGGLRIEWDEVLGAATYRVFVQDNPALTLFNPPSVPASPAATRNAYLSKGLPAVPKYVAVQAVDSAGKPGAMSAFVGPITPGL